MWTHRINPFTLGSVFAVVWIAHNEFIWINPAITRRRSIAQNCLGLKSVIVATKYLWGQTSGN